MEIFKIRDKILSSEAARSDKMEFSALEAKSKTFESKLRFRDDPEYIDCKEDFTNYIKKKLTVL